MPQNISPQQKHQTSLSQNYTTALQIKRYAKTLDLYIT